MHKIQSIEENGIRIYDNFYLEQDLTNDSTMRIFESRDQVNLACIMEGEFPKAANEIAIDRMYADNNKISIGDTSEKWYTELESNRIHCSSGLQLSFSEQQRFHV